MFNMKQYREIFFYYCRKDPSLFLVFSKTSTLNDLNLALI